MARPRRVAEGALVLDAQGLVKLATGDPAVRALVRTAHQRYDQVVTAASTLAEVLRGGGADARIDHDIGQEEPVGVVRVDRLHHLDLARPEIHSQNLATKQNRVLDHAARVFLLLTGKFERFIVHR